MLKSLMTIWFSNLSAIILSPILPKHYDVPLVMILTMLVTLPRMTPMTIKQRMMLAIVSYLLNTMWMSLVTMIVNVMRLVLMMLMTLLLTKILVILYSRGNTRLLMKIVFQQ